MISSRRLRWMLGLVVTACVMVVICSAAGAAPDPGLLARLRRSWTSSATWPPVGWHIRGEMGGVWAHPIKLLEGYWFSVDNTWLPAASRFTTGAGYIQMNFPNTAALEVTRTEFSPDGSPLAFPVDGKRTPRRGVLLPGLGDAGSARRWT
jgi:hypothetical protein